MSQIEQPMPNEPTFPCRICKRTFRKGALSKHEAACNKLQNKKRKTFDAGKQRATGCDIPLAAVRKVQKEIEKNDGVFRAPKTHWRERHEQFVDAVRAAKGVDHALKTGSPLPPPPRSHVPSDYVKCDYCGRNFGQAAAERHIPYCKEKNARMAPPSNQRKPQPPPSNAKPFGQMNKPPAGPARPAPNNNRNTGGGGGGGSKLPTPVNRGQSPARVGGRR